MIDRICGFINNFFTSDDDRHPGEYTIANGALELPFMLEGQYFRIVGSALNDGVYRYPVTAATGLSDETFTGEVWAMKVPKAFIDVCDKIKDWEDKYGDAASSPYQSENVIGVYSYTKAIGSQNGVYGVKAGWQDIFGGELNRWRKIA